MDVNFILRWSILTFFALRQEKYSFLDDEDTGFPQNSYYKLHLR